MWNDFFDLFFPSTCLCCRRSLVRTEQYFCMHCHERLPVAWHDRTFINKLEHRFAGRLLCDQIWPFLKYKKNGRAQQILHALKYHKQPELAQQLGFRFGKELLRQPRFMVPELLVPVPLHERRLKERGYNQSEMFANGLSEAWNIPVENEALERKTVRSSQTDKSRLDRWSNVQEMYVMSDSGKICLRHVMLVDDVITTGATMEACGKLLLNGNVASLSLASLAATV